MKVTRPLFTEDKVVFEKLAVTSATAKAVLIFRRSSIFSVNLLHLATSKKEKYIDLILTSVKVIAPGF